MYCLGIGDHPSCIDVELVLYAVRFDGAVAGTGSTIV